MSDRTFELIIDPFYRGPYDHYRAALKTKNLSADGSIGGMGGWEKKVIVLMSWKEDGYEHHSIVATISLASARCCGWNTIEGWCCPSQYAEQCWKTIRDWLNNASKTFSVGQLMYLGAEGHNYEILKKVPHRLVGTFQSASERGHRTAIWECLFGEIK